jgi:hypothetical protein
VTARSLSLFTEIWNRSCAPLPRLRKAPSGRDAERLIGGVWDAVDGDQELLARSITRAAGDELYQTHRYSWETFCRHRDRWIDDPVEPESPHVSASDRRRSVREQVFAQLRDGVPVDRNSGWVGRDWQIASEAVDEWEQGHARAV